MSLKIPTSLGTLPQSSGSVSEDLRFTGSDGTLFTVKGGVGSTYAKNNTIEYAPGKDKILFQFIFPQGTVMNSAQTEFQTGKQVYVFTEVPDVIIGTNIRKNMKGGSVEIREKAAPEKPAKAFLNNVTGIKPKETLNSIKSHPLYLIGYILYLWSMDMFRVLVFWVLLASIYCWLIVPSKYLYPSDTSKYPYVFYDASDNAYGYLKQKEHDLCTLFTNSDKADALKAQAKWFSDIDNLNSLGKDKNNLNKEKNGLDEKDPHGILKILKPSLVNHREDGVDQFSSLLINRCSKKDPCTADYLAYFFITLLFYNHLYCNAILSGVHSAASGVKNTFEGFPKFLNIALLAVLLYILFSGVGAVNKTLVNKLKIPMSTKNDMDSLIKNQFKTFIIAIFSCCLCIVLPLCSILIITCLMTTAYVLFKTIIAPYNAVVAILAIMTMLYSISQYVFIIRNLARGMSPLDLIESLFVSDRKLESLYSILGITIPILFGLIYGSYIGVKLFTSFFRFIKRPDVQMLFKSSFWSFLIVGFLLLLLHVQKNLGKFYATMTLSAIVLIGILIYFQQMALKRMKKGKDIVQVAEDVATVLNNPLMKATNVRVVNDQSIKATVLPNVWQMIGENFVKVPRDVI